MDDRKKSWRVEGNLIYPGHLLEPEDLLGFIESEVFRAAWKRCKLHDNDLFELQFLIAAHPKLHPVIKETGGVRKMRFTPTGTSHGKSCSHRALYAYYEDYGIVLLITAYPKSKMDNISASGKAAIKKMVDHQHKLLSTKGPIT